MPTTDIKTLLKEAAQQIHAQEARWLLTHVLACSHVNLIARGDEAIAAEQEALFTSLIMRRQKDEPLAYLLGSAPFFGREFFVSPAVLIPRPETELLLQLVLQAAQENPFAAPIRLLELGTGSGIIAISAYCENPHLAITATDLSKEALAVAQENAQKHKAKIRWREGAWFAPLQGERFHIIASNPPYIAKDDPHLLANGLPFEPQMALTDGHPDQEGMAALRTIIENSPQHLEKNGKLFLEHGYDQAEKVQACLAKAGFSHINSWQDEARIWRVTGGVWA